MMFIFVGRSRFALTVGISLRYCDPDLECTEIWTKWT